MKKIKILFILFILCSLSTFGQNGTPHIRIFTNFHSSFLDDGIKNEFEIQRAYLGYSHNFDKNISGSLLLDVGNPGVGKLDMTAYLKNAYVQYKDDRITTKFGMIGLNQFNLQENLWGGRYIYKSFIDEHKIGPSADIGAFFSYKFNNMFSSDITVANGEGYKNIQKDNYLKYSLGVTFNPIEEIDIRTSYDYMGYEYAQQTFSLYIGYSTDNIKFGSEYVQQLNHKMNGGNDLNGISVYGSYSKNKNRFFSRFDQLSTLEFPRSERKPWNINKDGKLFILGIEHSPVKNIKIAPNYQLWLPANEDSNVHIMYINILIKV